MVYLIGREGLSSLLARAFKNTLLRALQPEAVARLQLAPVSFELAHEIEYPGKPIRFIQFVEVGMASMTTTFQDGSQVEVGMFGFESVIGISALMGTRRALNRVYTQIAGHGYACSLENATREFARGELFQLLALRSVQAQLVQGLQSAGCNAKHSLQQRLARWLLICADRAQSTTFCMSQENLANMLGSSRPTVSIAAAALKEHGLIEYSRGIITILNTAGLERTSCECYQVIKSHLDNYAEFDSGITA